MYRITRINDDGTCSLGLYPTASIPLMVSLSYIYTLHVETFINDSLKVYDFVCNPRRNSYLDKILHNLTIFATTTSYHIGLQFVLDYSLPQANSDCQQRFAS
jgi:hypothetical protein